MASTIISKAPYGGTWEGALMLLGLHHDPSLISVVTKYRVGGRQVNSKARTNSLLLTRQESGAIARPEWEYRRQEACITIPILLPDYVIGIS